MDELINLGGTIGGALGLWLVAKLTNIEAILLRIEQKLRPPEANT